MADTQEPKFVDVRKIGRKGGKARAKKMSPEDRSEAARKAATERWTREKAKKAK
jgi:hypothetical protein